MSRFFSIIRALLKKIVVLRVREQEKVVVDISLPLALLSLSDAHPGSPALPNNTMGDDDDGQPFWVKYNDLLRMIEQEANQLFASGPIC